MWNDSPPGWFDIATEIRLAIPGIGPDELARTSALYGLAIGANARQIVEIGVANGVSTRAFLAVAEQLDGHVTSMDPGACPLAPHGHPRWTFIQQKSQVTPPRLADFLYVDGDHGYPAVLSDMARHGESVMHGGIIVLDDYNAKFPGKTRWVNEHKHLNPILVGTFAVIRVSLAQK